MSKEHEGKFDTARRYLRYISIGLIGIGGLFASGALVAVGGDIARH